MRSLVTLILLGSVSAASSILAEQSISGEVHRFFGEVQSVDLAAKTFTIKSGGRPLVFHYTKQTKISGTHEHMRWDKVRAGQGAAVVMRLGSGGIGVAMKVHFHASADYAKVLSEFRARTVTGEIISGFAIANHVVHEPPGEAFSRATEHNQGVGVGIFKLGVASDGTVAGVRPLKSLGNKERDERAAAWLKKWRFHPNSVTEVQIPVVFTRIR